MFSCTGLTVKKPATTGTSGESKTPCTTASASRIVSSQSSPCARVCSSRSCNRPSFPDHHTMAVVNSKKRYVNNQLNRKLGRVGKEMGTHILHENGTVCIRVRSQRPNKMVMKRNQKINRRRPKENCCKFLNRIKKKRRIQRHRVHHIKREHSKLMRAMCNDH